MDPSLSAALSQPNSASLQAFLESHIHSSAHHPCATSIVSACSRFSWTAGGSANVGGANASHSLVQSHAGAPPPPLFGTLSQIGLNAYRPRTGVRKLYAWGIQSPSTSGAAGGAPISGNSSIAAEWRRWEAHLNGSTPILTDIPTADAATTGANTTPPAAPTPPGQPARSPAHPGAGGAAPAANGAAALPTAAPAAAATASATSNIPPTLPCPLLSTGVKWNVTIDVCFIRSTTAAAAAFAADPNATSNVLGSSGNAAAFSRLSRVNFLSSLSSGGPFGEACYLVGPSSVVSGGGGAAGLSTWLETLGEGSHSAVQVKSVTVVEGEEFVAGDFLVRLGTLRQGSRVQPLLILEIEAMHLCTPTNEATGMLDQLALALGVAPATVNQSVNAFESFPSHGLSSTSYSLAHASVQYEYLALTRLKEILAPPTSIPSTTSSLSSAGAPPAPSMTAPAAGGPPQHTRKPSVPLHAYAI